MLWDKDISAWVEFPKGSYGVGSFSSTETSIEFDEITREVRLTIWQKFPSSDSEVILANSVEIKEQKEEWETQNSFNKVIVYPCNEIYKNSEYQENTFSYVTDSINREIVIPEKRKSLQFCFSSIDLEKSILGRLMLVFRGTTIQNDDINESLKEIRIDIGSQKSLDFLQKMSTRQMISISEITSIIDIEFEKDLEYDKVEINFIHTGDQIQINHVEMLLNNEGSNRYYFAASNCSQITSTSEFLDEKNITISFNDGKHFTLYSVDFKRYKPPEHLEVRGQNFTPRTIPLNQYDTEVKPSKPVKSSKPYFYDYDELYYLCWEVPESISDDIRLQIDLPVRNIVYDFSITEHQNKIIIVVPKYLRFRNKIYHIGIDKISFCILEREEMDNSLHSKNAKRVEAKDAINTKSSDEIINCIPAHNLKLRSLLFDELIDKIGATKTRDGLNIRLGEEFLHLSHMTEEYTFIDGNYNFMNQKKSFLDATVHILGSSVKTIEKIPPR